MTGSPNQSHYIKNQSDKRYASGLFAKKSQNSASYGSQGVSTNENESQRGFVPLFEEPVQSTAFAAKAEPARFQPENGTGDIEMQGVKEAHQGIHVRNDMNVDYSAKSG